MGIQKDAGEILLFIYNRYVNNSDTPNAKELLDVTKWDGKRIERALKYLYRIEAVDITWMLGEDEGVQNFIMGDLTPKGISMIEDKTEFKKNFGYTVKLGPISYSWGVSEK